MECIPLEITVASAKDLKDVNLLSKMDVYAVASIQGDPFGASQKQKTHVHKDSGPNPTWNFPMKFTLHHDSLQQNRLVLNIELKSDRSFGDKEIGQVHVPIKELLDSHNEKSNFKETSYSVRTPSGKSKGTLNLMFKFGDKVNVPSQEKPKTHQEPYATGYAAYPPQEKMKDHGEPVMAYPAGHAAGGTSSAAYPPPHYGGYAQQPPPPYYQPPPYGAYQGQPPAGYGYAQPGYGYPGTQGVQKPKKNGGKLALGLGAGLLGGLLVGDMISDVGEMGAYDAGFDDGFGF